MKQWKRLCAALLSGLLLTGSALAAGETVQVLQNVRFEASTATENQGKYTVTVTNDAIQNGKDYALLIAKGTMPENATVSGTMAMPTIDSTTLTYIDQTTATLVDSKPTVTFKNFIPKSVPNSVVLLGGYFNEYESPVVIGFINGQGTLVQITIPVVDTSSKLDASDVTFTIRDSFGTELVSANPNESGALDCTVPPEEGLTVVISRPRYVPITIKNYSADADIDSYVSQFSKCAGDVNSDAKINMTDITMAISGFNTTGPNIVNKYTDINRDNKVNMTDITGIISAFGKNKTNMTMEIQR